MKMKLSIALMILCSAFLVAEIASAQLTDDPQCGKQADNALCANDFCCSSHGFCGNEDPWCDSGCQSNCNHDLNQNGRCDFGKDWQCGKDRRCSIFGFCMNRSIRPLVQLIDTIKQEQCGRQAGGALCPNNLCCSAFGFCGSGSAWCGAGCQSNCRPNLRSDGRFNQIPLQAW